MQEQNREDRNAAMAERIRAAMKASRINMKQLADRAGIRYETMRTYMSGGRSMPARIVPDLARALNVSTDWLLEGRPWVVDARSMMTAVEHVNLTSGLGKPPQGWGSYAASFYLAYTREYKNRFVERPDPLGLVEDARESEALIKELIRIGGVNAGA